MSINRGVMRALQLCQSWSKRSASNKRLSAQPVFGRVFREPVHSSHVTARSRLHSHQKCPYIVANPMACTICR